MPAADLHRLRAVCAAALACAATASAPGAIDRRAVVQRHNPSQSSLPLDPTFVQSVGNGAFAFSFDATGLQSLNASFRAPFDLNTHADWAWHSSSAGAAFLASYNLTDYLTPVSASASRPVRYPTGYNSSAAAAAFLHSNPHRTPLAQLGLAWRDGAQLAAADLAAVAQTLDAWTGVAASNSTLRGGAGRGDAAAAVLTAAHPDVDALAARVRLSAPAARPQPLVLRLAFAFTLDGSSDWDRALDANHSSQLLAIAPGRFAVVRALDGDGYRVDCQINASWAVERAGPHAFVLAPPAGDAAASTDVFCLFAPRGAQFPVGSASPWLLQKRADTLALQVAPALPTFDDAARASAAFWQGFWEGGAFVDLASNTADADALELERRVVRSLYLLRALEAGAEPPAETGLLLAGNWFGKHHGEMRFWHQAWAPHWRHADVLERSDCFYADYLANATSVAAAQGYAGARWPKMIAAAANRSGAGVDVPWVGLEFAPLPAAVHNGSAAGLAPLLAWESSSGVGPLLVWQQSHSVFLAEAQRRAAAAAGGAPAALAVMQRLGPIVDATADFLASFPFAGGDARLHLGPPLFGGEESGDPLAISDPAFELVQIKSALDTAVAWRAALQLPRRPQWELVAGALAAPPLDPASAPLPERTYATNANCSCVFSDGPCAFARPGCPASHTSHPMLAGLVGMLNGLAGDGGARYGITAPRANATTAAVVANWSWGTPEQSPAVWGWDPPLVALSAARLGWSPAAVVALLLMRINKNAYSRVGINCGMGNATAYFPGNGGTLLAVAAMAAGFDSGAPGQGLAGGGPGALGPTSAPIGFPEEWGARAEGFNVALP